ncbi:MAG TPA: AraC family transcriptional regulator [Polyangiales bacterium]|nr:AraC family transcriptional regulator [Polyangiales bacterium]
MNRTREATVSLRWLVPVLRVTGPSTEDLAALGHEGLTLRELADPRARVRHRVASELIGAAAERLHCSELGLLAGEQLAPCDFDALELALRSCATLREAIALFGRAVPLLHGALESSLREHDGQATWELRTTDDVLPRMVCNDFALAAVASLCRRYLTIPYLVREVHVRHGRAPHASAYQRVFPDAEVRYGSRRNALVFDGACLEAPLRLAHAGLLQVYEAQLNERLVELSSARAMSLRVRQVLEEQLRAGDAGIASVAARLGLNVSTLRRALSDEGTTYRRLREELRSELAERYLSDRALTVSEVAFLLGFATVAAFSKAFRRGHQVPPTTYRARVRHSLPAARASL